MSDRLVAATGNCANARGCVFLPPLTSPESFRDHRRCFILLGTRHNSRRCHYAEHRNTASAAWAAAV
ncbi:MAG TPA: hypothetical protein VFO40_29185, partial [Chthoniobacterales bacterium]|nr:hypothetical protein [Chthoniobacterales bacterium]